MNDRPRADLIDPASLAALGRIEVVARWIVDGFVAGLHRSPRKGASSEFAEFRPYQPGDDPRNVDWKVAARADRWVVKQFQAETNLRATVVLDVSRSMDWSGAPAGRLTKRAYAERLAAAVLLLFLRQRDAAGLVRMDDTVRTAIPPRLRAGQWRRLVAALDASPDGAGETSNIAAGLEQAARLARRPGFVVLVSDLLVDVEPVAQAARALRAAGHELVVLHVLDPAERELSAISGDAIFVDPEGGATVTASVADVASLYRETVTQALDEWRTAFAGAGASYGLVTTDAPFALPLRRAFAARQSRR